MSLKIEQGFRLPEPLFRQDDPGGESGSGSGKKKRPSAIPEPALKAFEEIRRPLIIEVAKGGEVTVKKQVTPSGDTE